jgi:Growth inhibitor
MESVCNEVRRGEIYYAKLNPVRGSEQGKTRPVLILQNDVGNHYSSTTIVAAITGRRKRHCFPTHVPIKINGLKPSSVIMLEQIRTIDKSRILGYVGRADDRTMASVNTAISVSLGF